MRDVKLLLVAVLLLSVAAFAQLPNTPQAPPANPDQTSAPGQPAAASPAVAPVIKANPSVTRPQPDAPPQQSAVPSPALPANQVVRRIAMIDIAGEPGFNGIAFTGGFLVMSHSANNSVDVFNVRQRRLIKQIKDMEGAAGIAVDSKGETVYVANSNGDNIAAISTKDWQVLRTIKLEHSPNGLLLLPDQNVLYSASWRDQTISLIDLLQAKVIGTAEVNGSPEHMAYDPGRRELYATLEAQNQVAVLDPSLKVLRRFKLAASEPTGVVFDGKSNRLYVAVRYAVLALDSQSGKELGRIAAPAGVDSLVLNPADGSLYAGSEGGTVQMIRVGGGQFAAEQEIATDVRGHDVAIDPQTHMIFMPGGREGRAKLLLLKRVDAGPPTLTETSAK